MKNEKTIEEAFSPLSKWIAKTFFSEQFNRTLTQKVKEDWGIPKQNFHSAMISGAICIINQSEKMIKNIKK